MLFPEAGSSPPGNAAQMRPDWVAGRGYRAYFGYTQAPAGSVNAGSPNQTLFMPVFIPNSITIASIFLCGSGGSARAGFYADDRTRPGALLVDAGVLAFTGGFQSWSINYAATRGFYWIAAKCSNFFSGMTGAVGGMTTVFSEQIASYPQTVYLTLNSTPFADPFPNPAGLVFSPNTPGAALPYFYLRT